MEGNHCFNPPVGCNTGNPILTLPVQEYDHTQGDCSVTGGFVYRGTQFASMQGVYFSGDFCSGRIRGLRNANGVWQDQLLIDSAMNITTFGEDESGEIYVADYASGTIYKIYAIVNPERIGIFRQGNWYLDLGNLGVWQGCTLDSCLGPFGGFSFDVPVMGDWTGIGTAKIGIYRNGAWYLDRDGGGSWNGCGTTPGTDICFSSFGGFAEDIPVVGDWTGNGIAKIGIYRNGAWYLDQNGNGVLGWMRDTGRGHLFPEFWRFCGGHPGGGGLDRKRDSEDRDISEWVLVFGSKREWVLGRMRDPRGGYLFLKFWGSCGGHPGGGGLDGKRDSEDRDISERGLVPGFEWEWCLGWLRGGFMYSRFRRFSRGHSGYWKAVEVGLHGRDLLKNGFPGTIRIPSP